MEFKGKVAVITGGASGIGRSVALALAKLGTDIVVADIDDVRVGEVRQEIESMGRRVLAIHCDMSKDDDVNNLAAQTLSTLDKVDILMNNAGVGVRGYVEKLSMADWEWILGINLLGVIRGVHAFLPHMIKRGSGYIINTASAAGLVASEPPPLAIRNIPYATSKFGIVGFSEGLYGYLRPKGIMVSVLCPGMVTTNLRFHSRYVGSDQEIANMKVEGEEMFNINTPGVIESDNVAQIVVKAMKEKSFFILTHPEVKEALMNRGHDMEKLEKHLQDTFKG